MGSCLIFSFNFELNFGYEGMRFKIQVLIINQLRAVSQVIQIRSFLRLDILDCTLIFWKVY